MIWPTPHIRAWYSLSIATEPWSNVGGTFLSVMLERQARSLGYWAPDLTVSCSDIVEGAEACKTLIFGTWIETNSFSLYVRSLSMILQAVVVLSLGPFADDPYWRKRLIILFSLIGSTTSIAFLGFPSTTYNWILPLTALLTIIGYMSYSMTVVCANAFLPVLASEDGSLNRTLQNTNSNADTRSTDDERQPLLSSQSNRKAYSLSMSRHSSFYLSLGTAATVLILALFEVLLVLLNGTTFALRVCIGLTGLWWAIFTLPSFRLPDGDRSLGKERRMQWSSGLRRIGRIIRPSSVRDLPNLFRYLIPWFFLTDAFHTLPLTTILYGSSRLDVSPGQMVVFMFIAIGGVALSSLIFPTIQRSIGFSNKTTILICIALEVAVPLWASLGLIFPWAGLRTKASLYSLVLTGIATGPFISYGRAVYAEMIPVGHESSYFSLFSLADKSAAFTGPLLVGLITQTTGEFAYAFALIVVMLLLPVPILLWVNVDEGHEQAKRWVESRKDVGGRGGEGEGGVVQTLSIRDSTV